MVEVVGKEVAGWEEEVGVGWVEEVGERVVVDWEGKVVVEGGEGDWVMVGSAEKEREAMREILQLEVGEMLEELCLYRSDLQQTM